MVFALATRGNADEVLFPEIIKEVSQIVHGMDKARLYRYYMSKNALQFLTNFYSICRGRGSELLRSASCQLIKQIAKSALSILIKTQVSFCLTFVKWLNTFLSVRLH